MRALALDIGHRRVGVAVSDAGGAVASPLTVLDAAALERDVQSLDRLVQDWEVELLVVGLPMSLDGTEGPQAAEVRRVAERLGASLGLEVEFFDERLSSAEARRRMREAGMSERDQRGAVDKVAAAIMLQGWLDARRTPAQEDE